MELYGWALYDQNFGFNQIKKDWFILSWSAQWQDKDEVMYQDLRNGKQKFSIKNEKKMLKRIWTLLDEADVVVSQNGIKFDRKKLNARFEYYKMGPPATFKHFDTLRVSKKHFAFSSHSLEYMSNYFNLPFKKLKHKKYPGFDLWRECLENNNDAWEEMEKYNIRDTQALIGVYDRLTPWEPGIFNVSDYTGVLECKCGSKEFKRNGKKFLITKNAWYERLKCKKCGSEMRGGKVAKP